LGQTWFIDREAHLLQSRVIVNSNSSKNRYSGTIPFIGGKGFAFVLIGHRLTVNCDRDTSTAQDSAQQSSHDLRLQ